MAHIIDCDSQKNELLKKALLQSPLALLVVSEADGLLAEMNELATDWFKGILAKGTLLSTILKTPSGDPLVFTKDGHGSFSLGPRFFSFKCGYFCHNAVNFINVFLTDSTEEMMKLTQAEIAIKLQQKSCVCIGSTSSTIKSREGSQEEDDNMVQSNAQRGEKEKEIMSSSINNMVNQNTATDFDAFKRKCILNAGLSLDDDPDACMIRYSPTGVIVECSKEARGFQPEELIGMQSYEHMHPDDIHQVGTYHQSVLDDPRKNVPSHILLRKLHKNGSYVHTEFIGAYDTDEEGQRWITGVERVMSAERTQRLLCGVTDQLPCGVIVVDASSGLIDMINPKASQWFQLQRGKSFLGSLDAFKNMFSVENHKKLTKAVIQQSQILNNEENTEITVKTLTGREYSFLCRCSKEQYSDEATQGKMMNSITDIHFTWIINDITAIKHEMEEKHSAIIRFMRCTSHDMRTPMQAISLAAHSLAHGSHCTSPRFGGTSHPNVLQNFGSSRPTQSMDSSSHTDINTIISSSTVLEMIVSNILEFKTVSSMKLVPKFKPTDIKDNIERIVNMLNHSTLVQDGVDLSFKCTWEDEGLGDDSSVTRKNNNNNNNNNNITNSGNVGNNGNMLMLLDTQMLHRIVLNLVTNSLKFTTKGHVTVVCSLKPKQIEQENETDPTITSSSSDKEKKESSGGDDDVEKKTKTSSSSKVKMDTVLQIRVEDSGCGMDKDAQLHMGELNFFTGSENGSGLGTYIVRSYIQTLEGSMSVDSELGVGTTVSVEIPTCLLEGTKKSLFRGPGDGDVPHYSSSSSSSLDVALDDFSLDVDNTTPCASSSFNNDSESNEALPSSSVHDDTSFGDKKNKRRINLKITDGNIQEEDVVLVVEDVTVNRKLIVKSLERGGFKVDQAVNGDMALKMMLSKKYKTVFMDIDMPVMNGDEAVKQYWKTVYAQRSNSSSPSSLRSSSSSSVSGTTHPASRCSENAVRFTSDGTDPEGQSDEEYDDEEEHPMIIMLTGNITDVDRESALACGAHDYITKPVVPKQLWDAASWTKSPRNNSSQVVRNFPTE